MRFGPAHGRLRYDKRWHQREAWQFQLGFNGAWRFETGGGVRFSDFPELRVDTRRFLDTGTLRADAAHISRLHVLSYERLVTRPRETLDRVGDFLGLPSAVPADSVRDRSDAYRSRWLRLAEAADPVNRRRFRRLCERYEERANAYGYSLLDIDQMPPLDLAPRPA